MEELAKLYFPNGCDYCGSPVSLKRDFEIYGEDRGRSLWVCDDFPRCNTYIFAHEKPEYQFMPIGTLANQKVRQLRKEVHQNFDHFWMLLPDQTFRRIYTVCPEAPNKLGDTPMKPRMVAYWWLAEEMGIDYYSCAISKFDESQCRQAISICQRTADKFNYLIPNNYLK